MRETRDNTNYEQLLQKARGLDRNDMKRKRKERSILQRLFKPTPNELISEFGIRL